MYLFSRRGRLGGGNLSEANEWAVGITESVNRITGLNVSLYAQVYSPEFGTMVWSCFLPDLAALEAAGDKLLADDAYVAAADKGAAMIDGGLDDSLLQVIHGEVDPNRQIEYVTSVRTVCANGNLRRGLELGVEIAQRAEKVSGSPTMFLLEATGTYGGVGWVSGFPDVRTMETAQQALSADEEWLKYIDKEAARVYADAPGAATSLMYRHVA
jgi:hypothetical protein